MTFQERTAWAGLVLTAVVVTAYVVAVLRLADGGPVSEVDYQVPLLWSLGLGILSTIVATIAISMIWHGGRQEADVRDKEIERFARNVSTAFMVIGGLAGMILAMVEADWFWIANAIYLSFALSAILEGITKIAAYRFGFQQW
jgi:hypothetical protein